MDKSQAINRFWNSFGIKAYDENTVPEDAVYPRITYDVSVSGFDSGIPLSASLWYFSKSWENITKKADEIGSDIGEGGKTIKYDNGMLWIKRREPFYQRMSDPDENIRRILFSVEVEFLSEN